MLKNILNVHKRLPKILCKQYHNRAKHFMQLHTFDFMLHTKSEKKPVKCWNMNSKASAEMVRTNFVGP